MDKNSSNASRKVVSKRTFKQTRISDEFSQKNPEKVEKLSSHQLIYSMTGLILGIACVIGGVALFLFGVVGNTSWNASILGSTSTITDAAPGAVLFIVGLFIVVSTRYKFRIMDSNK